MKRILGSRISVAFACSRSTGRIYFSSTHSPRQPNPDLKDRLKKAINKARASDKEGIFSNFERQFDQVRNEVLKSSPAARHATPKKKWSLYNMDYTVIYVGLFLGSIFVTYWVGSYDRTNKPSEPRGNRTRGQLSQSRPQQSQQSQQPQYPPYADKNVMLSALAELTTALLESSPGVQRKLEDVEDIVSTDVDDIERHSYSSWSTTNSAVKPVAVLYPQCTEDVVAIAKICTRLRIPMVPYGAGSSVEGSFSAPHSGYTIDFSRMDKILEVHAEDLDVVVQPGVNWVNLNDKLKPLGLFLPLDPSPTALIGGMIATNCSGPNAMKYGTMKDWVMNVTVVLADGTVMKTRRRPRKSSAGYDLTRLIVGAEGTLGFVTEATLKLAIVPSDTGVATCSFKDIKTAAGAAVRMVREGIGGLAALEFMDEAQMQIINKNGGTIGKDGKTRRLWKEEPTLFLKFSGTDRTMKDDMDRVKKIVKEFQGSALEVARNNQEKDAIWAARKEALWAMLAQRDEGTEIWSTDVAVPLSRLAEIIDISKQESSQLGLFNSVLGHVGDGNFHQSVMYHPKYPEEKAKVAKCVENMMVRALEMEGTVSGEHAIGIGKKKSLELEVGPESLDFMRRLKLAVDPLWVMNPGKVFEYQALPTQ